VLEEQTWEKNSILTNGIGKLDIHMLRNENIPLIS
jgi:hypothetical protein